MKRVRFTEEQIIAVLREHEAGAKTPILRASTASRKPRYTIGRRSMVRPRSASVFWPLDLLVCINLSGLLLELGVLLAMMGSARPRPS